MSGSRFVLSRDLINPMDAILKKPCRDCGEIKSNDFLHFGKKLWRSRHEYTTNDVCKVCMGSKVALAHDRRREIDRQYESHKANELLKRVDEFKKKAER